MLKKNLIILMLSILAWTSAISQEQVTGVVRDAQGPLPGANVSIKGTDIGSMTDMEGNYSIEVRDEDAILIFSFIGYDEKEIKVNGRSQIDVTLDSSQESLQEVVVTAQGIKKSQKALGYAIAKVDNEEIERRPEADLARTLQGKVAGVSITPANGQTGSNSPIRIRGNISLTGSNAPLIIVNNVPFNGLLRDIDPNNIEQINILKGFNASVLYGSEGRNGVILIQTKSGAATVGKEQTSVSYSTTIYTNTVSQLPEFQNIYSNGGEGEFSGTFLSNWGPAFSDLGEVPHPYSPLGDIFPEYEGLSIPIEAKPNNVKNIFRSGIGTTHSLNFSSSKEKVAFNLSAGYTDEKGIIANNDLKRFNLSIGGNAQITEKLNISATLNYSNRKVNLVNDEDIFNLVFYLPRWIDLTELPYEDPATGESVYYRNDTNPLWILNNSGNRIEVPRTFGTFSTDYQLNDNINLTYRVGLDHENPSQFDYSNKGGFDNNSYKYGYLDLSSGKETVVDQTFLASFNYDLTEALNMEAQIGANSKLTQYEISESFSDNQIVYDFFRPSNFDATQAGYTTREENLAGVFGQFQFAFKNYLYATLSGRNDWGSTVESDYQSLFYPGASLSFIPTSAFDFSGPIINYLKLRGAYATSSGYPGTYRTRGTLVTDPRRFAASDGSFPITNRFSTRYANPNLKPELHKEFEIGIETNLFKNSVTLEASFYKRISEDQIVGAPLAGSSGFDTQFINLGRIDNEGVEVDLGIDIFETDDFSWNFRNIFTANESLVVKTTPTGADINITEDRFAVEGRPFGVIKGDYALRDDEGNLLISGNGSGTRVGEVISSSNIGLADKVIGDPNPDWRLTNINRIAFKDFNFSMQWEYRHGGEIHSSSVRNMLQRGVTRDTEDRDHSFVIPGYLADDDTGELLLDPNGDKIRNSIQMNSGRLGYSNYYTSNDLATWDTSILRLREISLGYSLRQSKFKNIPFERIDFTLSGRNLWYRAPNFPKYVNYDPENDGFEGDSTIPSTRRIALGVSVNF